ncbi:MAG: hypothetical protein GXP60_03680 [Epsilonproteobacteria bacterium]|nr:hypothetical protein [Campylobacterota bacterium]
MRKIIDFKTILVIIGLVIPIFLFLNSKSIKELSFKNIAITELVSEKDITDDAIKVYFDNVRVFNLYSVSCLLVNSGNQPVTKNDFSDYFRISFPDSVQILKYSIRKTPESIILVDTALETNNFNILPDLLNPNESLEFSFYISSPNTDLLPMTKSRLIGGEVLNLDFKEEIKSKTEFSNMTFSAFYGWIYWISLIYTILVIGLMFWASYFQDNRMESAIGKFLIFLLISFGLFCNLFYLIQTK